MAGAFRKSSAMGKKRAVAAVVGMTAATTAIVAVPFSTGASAAAPLSGVYQFRNLNSGLLVTASAPTSGSVVEQRGSGTGYLETWRLVDMGDGYSAFRNVGSDLCLDDPASTTTMGARMIVWTCRGGDNQRWRLIPGATSGTYAIQNKASRQVLDIPDWSTHSGVSVQQWQAHGGTNQSFAVKAAAAPSGSTGTASAAPLASTATATSGMPVGNLTGWRQTFAEDFKASTRPSIWHPYASGVCCANKYNDSARVTYHDGLMDISVQEVNGVYQGTGGQFGSSGSIGMRTAMRIRTDRQYSGAGLANMLWPSSEVWDEGEVDYPEVQFNSTVKGFVHKVSDPRTNALAIDSKVTMSAGWHVYVTEWVPGTFVRFYLDGTMIGENITSVPRTVFDWRFQVGDNSQPHSDSKGGHVLIDWVAQWVRA